MTRKAFVVYVDLDDIPGVMHTQESAQNALNGILQRTIPHYNPVVSLAPAELQPDKSIAEIRLEREQIKREVLENTSAKDS